MTRGGRRAGQEEGWDGGGRYRVIYAPPVERTERMMKSFLNLHFLSKNTLYGKSRVVVGL